MAKTEVTILNKRGLSAPLAAKLSQTANRYSCAIWLESVDRRVDAKNVVGVMLLGAQHGTRIGIEAEGADAERALQEVSALVQDKFGKLR